MKYTIILFTISYLFLTQPVLAEKTVKDVQTEFVEALLQKVLINDGVTAQAGLNNLERLLNQFKQSASQQNLQQIQAEFRHFIPAWKSVEAVYVAGALDENYLDHPRYIDFFNHGNESIDDLVERAVNGEVELHQALFKNSTKSINALEYLLFGKTDRVTLLADLQARNNRRIEAALLVLNNIQSWLDEIVTQYKSGKMLLVDSAHSVNMVVNALLDSSFKLLNWRVGEPGGLVNKYQHNPSAGRLEYHLSATSGIAMRAILQTHRKIIDRDGEQDLLAIARAKNVETELLFIRQKIDQALSALDAIPLPLSRHIESNQYRQFYKRLARLHDAYYFMMIDALGLNVTIIDADGD